MSSAILNRFSIGLTAAVMLCSAPCAAEQPCPAAADPAERFQCARLLARQGDHRTAIRVFETLTSEFPDNVDYLFGEAQARWWSGDAEGALRLLPRARRLAPQYEELWRLEYQVLRSLAGPDAQRRADAFRSAALQRFPDASWLDTAAPPDAPRLHWEVGTSIEFLDNGAADWRHFHARIGGHTANDSAWHLSVAEHRRFSLTDRDVAIGGSLKAAENWIVHGNVQLAADAEFLPETMARLAVSRVLTGGWIAGIDLGQRRYPNETVDTYGVEVERYFARFRAAWQLQNTQLDSASSFVQVGTLDYYAESGTRYRLTAAVGDEVDIVAPGQLHEMDISAFALSGTHPLGERLKLTWRIGTHRQGSFYRRTGAGLSIAGAF